MCTARPSYKSISFMQTFTYKDRMFNVKLDMANIMRIDDVRKTVTVEPMVTVGQLNDYLVTQGWTLPIVPELDDLTIGGLVMGGGLEVTSFKYGLFQEICRSYELVMADGSVKNCSRHLNSDLYHAVPLSYGTIGFLTAVTIEIIPFKPYLELKYTPVYSQEAGIELLTTESLNATLDTVEGFMFSKEEGVIMSGRYVDVPTGDVNEIGWWYKPWFYEHVRSILEEERASGGSRTEVVPTLDFFRRHQRPIFWLLRYGVSFGNNPIYRQALLTSLAFRYLTTLMFQVSLRLALPTEILSPSTNDQK